MTLPSPDDRNGPIGYYTTRFNFSYLLFLFINRRYEIWVATGNATLPNSSFSYDEAHSPKAAYVAAVYAQPPSSFVLGNNTNTSFNGTIYRNVLLMRGVEYRVIVRVFTQTPSGQVSRGKRRRGRRGEGPVHQMRLQALSFNV